MYINILVICEIDYSDSNLKNYKRNNTFLSTATATVDMSVTLET
jgi:hypothetical protein